MKRWIVFVLIFSITFMQYAADYQLEEPPYAYKVRGDRYRRMGSEYYALALREYERAIQQRRNYSECYYWTAWIFKEKGLYDQALMEIDLAIQYKEALEYKSLFIDMLYLKSEIFFKSNKNSEGKKVLEEIVDYLTRFREQITDLTEPIYRRKFGMAFFLIGTYYRHINDLNVRKAKFFLQAIQLGFRPDMCHYFLHEFYKSKGNDNEANSHLESVKRILKQNGKTLEELKSEISLLSWSKIWTIRQS